MTNKPTAELIPWHKGKAENFRKDAKQYRGLSEQLMLDIAENHQATADRLAELEAALKTQRDFYLHFAVSTLVGLHGAESEAADLAAELGVTVKRAKELKMAEYDIENLTSLAKLFPYKMKPKQALQHKEGGGCLV